MNKTREPLPIANRPDQSHPNDECCTVCGDDKMWVVIKGGQNCGYCGNQINLCQKCYYRFRRESMAMDLDSCTPYDTTERLRCANELQEARVRIIELQRAVMDLLAEKAAANGGSAVHGRCSVGIDLAADRDVGMKVLVRSRDDGALEVVDTARYVMGWDEAEALRQQGVAVEYRDGGAFHRENEWKVVDGPITEHMSDFDYRRAYAP